MTDRTVIGSTRAAEMLGIDASTLTRWIIAGRIPAEKLGGDKGPYVLDLADVERLAATRSAYLAELEQARQKAIPS